MNSDGSNKAALPAGVFGVPSRALHGGHRWFLEVRYGVGGEFYPSGADRREIFAVRDDGAISVQLTDQGDLEPTPEYEGGPMEQGSHSIPAWAPGDANISFIARRWVGGVVVEGGIYTAAPVYDGAGNIVGLDSQPASPTISFPIVSHTYLWGGQQFPGVPTPDVHAFDWAPDGTRVCCGRETAPDEYGLWIAEVGGAKTMIVPPGFGAWFFPKWSPAGTKILLNASLGIGNDKRFFSVNPDGTGLKLMFRGMYGGGHWSPTGSHITFYKFNGAFATAPYEVYRAKADGTQRTSLASGTPTSWR
jgi:hypothetical protein